MAGFQFGAYRLDAERMELWRGDELVAIEPQVFSLLQFLIEQRNRVVSKDALFEAVWQGRIISDAALNTRINAVRRAVGDSGKDQKVVRTIPRRGFRFVAEVSEITSAEAGGAVNAADLSAHARNPSAASRAQVVDMKLPDKPSIVVLPFENLSDDAEQEYFSDGITEDITTALSQIRWLFVIARNSAFSYKGQPQDVRKVAGELGVRYILEGSVRKSGEHVRISAQLIDGTTGHQVWGNRYDRTLADIFQLQDTMTETIIGEIEPELGRAERQRARAKKPENLDAWDLYQQGMWHLYRRTKVDLAEALDFFNRALALDRHLSPALCGAVDAYYYEVVLGHSDDAAAARDAALQAARNAIEIDANDAAVRNAMGKARILRREHEAAIPELELALELNPSLAWSHYGIGAATNFSGGDPAHAVEHIAAAIRLSPRDAHLSSFMVRMADAHLAMQDYDTAVQWATGALRQPGFQWSRYTVLASALGHQGKLEEAAKCLEELRRKLPEASVSYVRQGHLFCENKTFEHYLEGLRKAGAEE